MMTRTQDQMATVLALRPPGRDAAADGPTAVALGGPAREEANVIDLAHRRPTVDGFDFEPQGGDAA